MQVNSPTHTKISFLKSYLFFFSAIVISACSPMKAMVSDASTESCHPDKVDIPNAFSPNNDGANDTWDIRFFEESSNVHTKVYNSWGALVFESTFRSVAWNGEDLQGNACRAGIYFYTSQFQHDGSTLECKGTITLLR